MQVFCDFDGTISKKDVTDLVLQQFALPEWHAIEDQWTAGRITSAQCMERQVRLIRAERDTIDAFLDTVEIDEGFVAFRDFCRAHGLPLTIVSDGVAYFIRRVLSRHGMPDIPVIANRLVASAASGGLDLAFPFMRADCAAGSGVCKCAVVSPSPHSIYVGDGRSDFCVSRMATAVFAKAKLADYCASQRIAFIPYDGFADVQASVAAMLSTPSRQPFARPLAKSA
ncbi:2,3-diketo-5-methylthio-1-phosphopentane phosphatase [Neorhizobium galegae]|uniref:MtnX-like HAD-IB family phosphatase n=1 Tax=Neorhizobium galegae TaxID=399 RepID=UPI001AE7D5FC|nr:MtnX-like HAD-IB family phosphatase [Neorhizobium galegae]MBP2548546.1 2,3-diketo-5-methylthio-1-phosphopentane phosphatase [Neorhizobium galegae]